MTGICCHIGHGALPLPSPSARIHAARGCPRTIAPDRPPDWLRLNRSLVPPSVVTDQFDAHELAVDNSGRSEVAEGNMIELEHRGVVTILRMVAGRGNALNLEF